MDTTTTTPQDTNSHYDSPQRGLRAEPALERPVHGRMVAGVAAGVARYIGVDPAVVRIVIAVLAVAGGFGVPLYLAGWLLIPEEGREQSLASDLIQSFRSR